MKVDATQAGEAWAMLEELRHLEDVIQLMPPDHLVTVSLEALQATIRLLELSMLINGAEPEPAGAQPWWLEWQDNPPPP